MVQIRTGKDITMLGFLILPVAVVVVGVIKVVRDSRKPKVNLYLLKTTGKSALEEKIDRRIIRKEAFDEVSRKCLEVTSNREMPYLSVEEVDAILKELIAKDKKSKKK